MFCFINANGFLLRKVIKSVLVAEITSSWDCVNQYDSSPSLTRREKNLHGYFQFPPFIWGGLCTHWNVETKLV